MMNDMERYILHSPESERTLEVFEHPRLPSFFLPEKPG
jgi:hypothetical protein